ncbi:MAG TPA: transposase [Phycisphaerae bacterium]|nr:transposase [Phycisphaerae bacterium]
MTLVSSFQELLQQVSCVMTAPTFVSFVTIVTGWVFARRRTITGMILAADAVNSKHHSAFHRVFATARWSLDALGLAVFDLILPWLGKGPVLLALDDTLARKRGLKIFGVGMHHDPLLSTRKVALTSWGHSWVVLGVIVRLPFCPDRYFCLPILFRLYVNKKTATKKRLVYRTRPELAVEMLQLLCPYRENRRFHAMADSAYGGKSVYRNLPDNCDLTSRLDLDARLHEPAPARKPGTPGRPRRRGARLPSPREMLQTRGRRLTLNIYGRKDRVRLVDRVAYLYAMPERPVRAVAVEPLTGGRTVQAFYSTCHEASATDVLTWYALRWSIEEAFQHSKGHLGFEQPQGWTRRAVERTAPTAMLLYSLIMLWFASVGHRCYRPILRPWYRSKARPSFADMLATLRQESVRQQVSALPLTGRGSRNVLKSLIHAVKQAA